MSAADGTHQGETQKAEREIEEDVMNVPVIAWLGTVATILIAVSVILLIGVFYLTEDRQLEVRQQQADARITELEAHRQIDEMVVDGYFQQPDVEENGAVTRGKVSVPVEIGMRQIAEKY